MTGFYVRFRSKVREDKWIHRAEVVFEGEEYDLGAI